eukprot:GHVU01180232.1.p1 GENE.GHVU01180232.1~~GHVU01180232.1.p1  ORF type:complete len:248 (+),score=32.53 GHVU01180232.1:75-818(+)
MRKIILGVVGNMGVEADICFQSAILEKTEAATDQDHIAVVVVKNPDIPDRSTAILKGGTSPVEQICATVRVLERAGCKLAVMPCVTAHYFLKEIQQSCKDIEFVSILDATGDALKRLGEGRVVGLLATTGTVNAKVFEDTLNRSGLKWKVPAPGDQETLVHAAIYGIKAGRHEAGAASVVKAVHALVEQHGVNTVILGCTELPLIQKTLESHFHGKVVFVNPLEALAEKAVSRVRALEREVCQTRDR